MTSQGQRFRRRALRRGYKVDEVDAFLDRVEATLAGEPLEAPVTAQEVHDVVFRVRFGGYDEWQVDLHLDRVERQLAEAVPLPFGRGPELPERLGPPERMGPPVGAGPGPGIGPGPGPQLGPGPGGPGGPGPAGIPPHLPAPMRPVPAPAPAGYHDQPGPDYGPYDEPTYGGYDGHPPARSAPPARPDPMSDMTSEMRFGGDPGGPPGGHGMREPGPGPRGGPTSYPPPPPPMSAHPSGPPGGGYDSGGFDPAGYGGAASGDLQRLDELRRTFQPRRFGSGYDRNQVDRLFEEVMAGMAGHGPMSVTEAELDPRRFDLVSGGYFEADVETALVELRDILRRH